MGLFWKRKSGDQFVSLKLNEPPAAKAAGDIAEKAPPVAAAREAEAESARNVPEEHLAERSPSSSFPSAAAGMPPEPVPTGGGPTPIPSEVITQNTAAPERRPQSPTRETEATTAEGRAPKPVATAAVRSPFQTSVL